MTVTPALSSPPPHASGRQRWPWLLASVWLAYSVLLLAWLDSSSALAGLLCIAN